MAELTILLGRECPTGGSSSGPVDSSNKQCYRCQEYGHISRDCTNPNAGGGGGGGGNYGSDRQSNTDCYKVRGRPECNMFDHSIWFLTLEFVIYSAVSKVTLLATAP